MINEKDLIYLVPECLEKLNKIQELPDSGLLAGGSVANFYWSHFTENDIVINDIDIFVLNKKTENIEYDKKKNFEAFYKLSGNKKVLSEHKRKSEIDEYTDLKTEYKNDNYFKIEDTKRDKLLNYVNYSCHKVDELALIKTFDINCTQIGIDLKTKKLYFTEEFLDFLNNKELKVTALNSPCHTAVRIVKKKEELNAGLDIEKELNILKTIIDNRTLYKDYIRTYFSDKYKNMFLENSDILREYFLLKPKEYSLSFVSTIGKSDDFQERHSDFKDKHRISGSTIIMMGHPLYEEYKKDVLQTEHNLFTLKPIRTEEGDDIFSIKYNSSGEERLDLKDHLYKIRVIDENETLRFIFEKTDLSIFLLNKDYLTDNNVKDPNIRNKVALVDKTIQLFPKFLKSLYNMTFDQQYEFIKNDLYKDICYDRNYYFMYRFSFDCVDFVNEEHKEKCKTIFYVKNLEAIRMLKKKVRGEKLETPKSKREKIDLDTYDYRNHINAFKTYVNEHMNKCLYDTINVLSGWDDPSHYTRSIIRKDRNSKMSLDDDYQF
jgi:hypothetical protein